MSITTDSIKDYFFLTNDYFPVLSGIRNFISTPNFWEATATNDKDNQARNVLYGLLALFFMPVTITSTVKWINIIDIFLIFKFFN